MANHTQGNVQFVDTTATFADIRRISAIKYIGAAASSVVIKADGSGGDDLWEANTALEEFDHAEIRNSKGIHVIVTGTAKVYLYLGTE